MLFAELQDSQAILTKGKDFEYFGSEYNKRDPALKKDFDLCFSEFAGEQIDSITIENCGVNLKQVLTSLKTPLLELSLQDADIMPQECSLLASDPRVAQLTHLDLSCNSIGFQGVNNLLKTTSCLKDLESLSLFSCDINQEAFKKSSKYTVLPKFNHIKLAKLRSLNLSYNELGQALVSCMLTPKFGLASKALETLQLVAVGLKGHTELKMSVFNSSEVLTNLLELDLSENKGFNFAKFAGQLPAFNHLATLHLAGSVSEIGQQDLVLLAKLEGPISMVRRLDLQGSQAGNWVASLIASSPLFKNLQMLNLANSEVDEEGVQSLVNSPHLGGLEILLLAGNLIKELPSAATAPGAACLRSLKVCDLRYNPKKKTSIVPSKSSLWTTSVILEWKKDVVNSCKSLQSDLRLPMADGPQKKSNQVLPTAQQRLLHLTNPTEDQIRFA